jgi:segregation and condensation protein B
MDPIVEALLFIADGPLMVDDLAAAAQVEPQVIEDSLQRLCNSPPRSGLCIVRMGSRVQMVTAPEAAPAIERLLGIDQSAKLSMAALETLAIIAYRQPVTRAQVEAIRGVNSDAVIRSLLAKSLIRSVGRLEQAGRPELLGTTFEFLHYFGARSLTELPQVPEADENAGG